MRDLILRKKNIVIVSHKSPDGDAVGSSLSLKHYLLKLGLDSKVILPDDFPSFYNWMNGAGDIIIADKSLDIAKEIIAKSDLIFCLDFNDLHRVGDLQDIIEKSDSYKIMIDHHQHPSDFANHIISRTECCSTAQLIYEFIEENNDLDQLDKIIGEGIYTGIITDSGSFKYSNVESKTHLITSHLIELGLDHTLIHEKIFDQNDVTRLHLLGYALNKIEVIEDAPVAFIALSKKDLNKFNFSKGATEGLVNYCLSIKDVQVAAFIREDHHLVKMSFRSKGKTKVNEFASKYFEGGGHINAAGGKSALAFSDVVEDFKKHIVEFLA